MGDHAQRRPLPVRLTPAERDFYVELRRLVDAAGLSFRVLEESTSAARSDSGQSSFFSKSQWGRWLNGQSRPPRKAVRRLAEKLGEEDIDAEHLVDLWSIAFMPLVTRRRPRPQLPLWVISSGVTRRCRAGLTANLKPMSWSAAIARWRC